MSESSVEDGGEGPAPTDRPTLSRRLKLSLFGPPRNLNDRRIFHNMSVVAFLAWVGLGADGLSSSCYGPEEAFRTLGIHTYLSVGLALAMVITVSTIAIAYSRVIEHFPHGGGGYFVASTLIGKRAGLVSGSALLVDYVLTVTVSIAAAGDALFSLLPLGWHVGKLPTEIILVLFLIAINIRGVKESILILLPVFMLFLVTHAVMIVGGIAAHAERIPQVVHQVHSGFNSGLASLGMGGMLLLFVHAYALGGGTYTGIEAVSNGLTIMREPRVRTGKRTMMYMAISLAFTASGLILCYLLWSINPETGKTMNAVLAERMAGTGSLGHSFVVLALLSEALLLVVAAQAGFVDGPRVLANMAGDSWAPHRFASLSDRLNTSNGIFLMGGAALAALLYTKGGVQLLVVMYSINVFLTFSMTELGMCRLWFSGRKNNPLWKRKISIHLLGLIMCVTIFVVVVLEKFDEGGWVTVVITAAVVASFALVKRHYARVAAKLRRFDEELPAPLSRGMAKVVPLNPLEPVAAVLVGGFSGVGRHTAYSPLKLFPHQFQNFLFLSVGVVDSTTSRAEDGIVRLTERTRENVQEYVSLFAEHGIAADYRMAIGTEAVEELEKLCLSVAEEFPKVTFFAGQLVFGKERWYQSLLHNQTAFVLQKRLQLAGHALVIVPAKVT